jgi:translation initiation factor 2 subunit 2
MPDEEEEPQDFDFGKKRKKKKDKKEKEDKEDKADDAGAEGESGAFEKGPAYTYDELLTRLYKIIEDKNPSLGDAKKYLMKPPQMVRVGSKKVAWVNFSENVQMMNRPVDHVYQFVLAEFGTEGSIAGDGQLILKGRYMQKHTESLLRKYIKEFVTCGMCKSGNTTLERDQSSRLYMVICSNCNATRNAVPIKAGFHATTRADRKKAKAG